MASALVVVHDQDENLVAGVTVSGRWSEQGSGSPIDTCVTNQSGSCTVTTAEIDASIFSTIFTLRQNGLRLTGYTYEPTQNHDPDGCELPECNGVVVNQPALRPNMLQDKTLQK